MSDCSQHKKEVAGISDMKLLAEMIGDLHYKTLGEFLNELQNKLWSDSKKDAEAGKKILSDHLGNASDSIGLAMFSIKLAYQISKPFMKKEH